MQQISNPHTKDPPYPPQKTQARSRNRIWLATKKAEPKVLPTLSSNKNNEERGARKTPMYNYGEHNMNHIGPPNLGENHPTT